ncbi:MAG TPA: hypothetical protein VHA30_03800 [Patescibacteria group bacterium]|nr:hypothetical protein [Patescibacteria group bacterium]
MAANPKTQTSLLVFSTFLAAFSLASIISFTDPKAASWITFAFFYASLFLFSLGIFTLLGLGLRQWLAPGLYVLNLGHSFRQALLLALLITISVILLSKHLLFWWVEASLILFFAAIEAFLNLKA